MDKELLPENHARILIVDDNEAIHDDIRKVLKSPLDQDDELKGMEEDIFGEDDEAANIVYEIDSAYQGQEAYEMVVNACDEGRPYSMAFVDMRMPPGWDGVETIEHMWGKDPNIETVICTAYADQSWAEIVTCVGNTDKLIIIKKPFEIIEIQQMVRALTTKWSMHRELEKKLNSLEGEVISRTKDLTKVSEKLEGEIKVREKMEVELRHAQKLEAVGQMAAGIAHEINTPVQFVGDSVNFLNSAFTDLKKLIDVYRTRYQILTSDQTDSVNLVDIENTEKEIDLDYLSEEVPRAFNDTIEGITRVAAIVRAMKQFAHPASEQSLSDLNDALRTTLTVANNEYKYIADIETDFDENLPKVVCQLGDLNQVFLNLIVNSAHAIGDNKKENDEKGKILIKTRQDGEMVIISISDDGPGIPKEIHERVFEPFFTTKEVGKGTGQGLAIAHSMVTEKHGGKLYFETEKDKGTTFFICLPIDGKPVEQKKAS